MMRTMRMCPILAQRIAAVMHLSQTLPGLRSSCQQSLAGRVCLQQITLVTRHISRTAGQQQRSAVPTVDSATTSQLRSQLQLTSDRELRQLWRRTGTRLDPPRATNALLVLAALEREGVHPSAVKRYPVLLNIASARLIYHLSAVRRLPAAVQDVFPLLLLRPRHLLPAVKTMCDEQGRFPGAPCRLHYLADQLEVSLEVLCAALRRSPSVLASRAERVIQITRLLIDGGVSRESILDDPYIYLHNIEVMHERLEWLHRVELQPLRPWMLRCAEHTLREHVERFQLRLAILSEHSDEVGYLSERLGLVRAQVLDFQQRHPPVLHVSVVKLKAVLDVLLSYGFSGAQVAMQPRILCYSARRIRERCERLRAAGLRPTSLLVLCKTPRDFDRYMAAASCERPPPSPSSEHSDSAADQAVGSVPPTGV